jgi:predicted RNA methylase
MLNKEYAAKIFSYLYDNIDGYSVSNQARIGNEDKKDLLYGELPFETCVEILTKSQANLAGNFIDIGSGTGRVVMAFNMLANFKKSVGVELLAGLHDKAIEIKTVFDSVVKNNIIEHHKNHPIEFYNKNIFDFDLTGFDVVFMNHPFKEGDAFNSLEEKFIKELAPNAKIITIIRGLKNPAFKNLGSAKYQFSWGESTAYFHEIVKSQ